MKILEAFGEPIADGGQEALVFGVMERMDMTGMTIDCLTAYDCRSDRYKTLVESKGGRVYSLDLPFAPGKSRNNIIVPFRRFLKTHPYDVIHIHSGSISVLAIMASVADKAGVRKVIVHSHATGEKDSVKHRVLRYLASLSMRRHVDVYCACSRQAAYWKYEQKYAKKAQIIKNGIEINRFRYNPEKRNEIRAGLGLSGCDYVLGHVGRFTDEKNHQFLLELYGEVLGRDKNAKLLLVGAGNNYEKIKKMVKKKNLNETVFFTGSVTNVEDYLQAMDVFIMPSLYEGLGIAAVEAQCTGLPTIVSDRVPKDIKATQEVAFLSLDDPVNRWISAIETYRYHKRFSKEKYIVQAGFDIKETVSQIKKLYLQE